MFKSLTKEGRKFVKDVSIGILTTVIGATLIYFLGFYNKEVPLTKLEREEITVDAWKTYATIENIYIEVSASLLQDVYQNHEFEDISKESTDASDKFKASMEDLVKTKGIDKILLVFLKNRLKTEKTDREETQKFYKELVDSKDTLQMHFTQFAMEATRRFTQTAPEIESLADKLSKKFNQPFKTDDFLVIQATKYKKAIFSLNFEKRNNNDLPPDEPGKGKNEGKAVDLGEPARLSKQYLIAKWETGNADINLRADGKLSWLIPADSIEVKGNWVLKDNQLVMNISRHPVTKKNTKWVFNISGVMTRSFTITQDTVPFKSYTLLRK